MSSFVHSLGVAAVASLILAGGASPGTINSSLEPPELVTPAEGQSFTGGTPIVFQTRTFPGDSLLVLHVSRSQVRSDCGVIDSGVTLKFFSPSSDPSLYQAAPSYYPGGWMDTPGTYYWQAYRAAGADGCVESEVRSFTITPGPSLMPPTLVSPAPKEAIRVGTPISFQIKTHPGDASLSLRVSRTVTIDAYGRLRGDVLSDVFSPTSDPTVYELKPTHISGDWMDTSGTYYWQAYRSVYGAGTNGYVVAEVRSFTITNPPPKSLAAARLEGQFGIYLTIRSALGTINLRRGQVYRVLWTFTPRCGKGSCRTKVDISSLSTALSHGTVNLKRKGAVYKKSQRDALGTCFSKPVPGPLKLNLRVTKGYWIANEWRAVEIKGTLAHATPPKRVGNFRCRASKLTAGLSGELVG